MAVDTTQAQQPQLRLRACRDEDLTDVVAWVRDAEELYLFTGSALTWPLTSDQLRAAVRSRGVVAFTLVDLASSAPDAPLGHVELATAPPNGGGPRLARVLLAPHVRGRGWAGELVSLAVAEARARGVASLALTVIASNEAAVRTYRRLGFVVSDQPRPDALAMRLDL